MKLAYGEKGTEAYDLVPEVLPTIRDYFPVIPNEKIPEMEELLRQIIDEALSSDVKKPGGNKRPHEMPDHTFLKYAKLFLKCFPEVPNVPEKRYIIEELLRSVWHAAAHYKFARSLPDGGPGREWPADWR
jgi:hypothetical protein